MKSILKKNSKKGSAMVEYTLIVALVSIATIATLQKVGESAVSVLQKVEAELATAGAAAATP